MGLGQVDTRGADLLPQKRHRIEPKNLHAIVQMLADNFDKLFKHHGVSKIKVNLVVAERTPNMLCAFDGFRLHQQWRRARTDNVIKIVIGRRGHKITATRIDTCFEVFKPRTPTRAMIDHQIAHQSIVLRKRRDIIPTAQALVNAGVIKYGKAIIRRPRKIGQHMHTGDKTLHMIVHESSQSL